MKKWILWVYVFSLGLYFPTHQIYAQATGKGLTIIPPRFELQANPGDNLTENVKLRNDSDLPATYKVVVEDFTSSGEEGGVIIEEGSDNQAYSLAQWITPSVTEVTLQPNEETTFSYAINVPKTAEPGGHYASVLFTNNPIEQTPGAANVSTRLGPLVLLRVSGNVTEKAAIQTFETPTYLKNGPVDFTLRILNEGNVHVQPKGTIIITDMFGKKVDEVPLKNANVLPGSVRKTDTVWDKANLLGRYTATLVATYGQQNLPMTAATRFTVASPTTIVLIIVAAIALIVFIVSLIFGRSRFKKAMKALTTGQ